jgi:hypothetical protein
MSKEFFVKNKNGFLTGLIIALFVVAGLLLGRAGLLGETMSKMTGDLIGSKKATVIRMAPAPDGAKGNLVEQKNGIGTDVLDREDRDQIEKAGTDVLDREDRDQIEKAGAPAPQASKVMPEKKANVVK